MVQIHRRGQMVWRRTAPIMMTLKAPGWQAIRMLSLETSQTHIVLPLHLQPRAKLKISGCRVLVPARFATERNAIDTALMRCAGNKEKQP